MNERDSNASAGSPPDAPVPTGVRLLGLRLRIWAACLAGALVSVAATWWIAGTQITVRTEPSTLLAWLLGAGTLGIVVAIAGALWIDHGIVVHLRGLTRGFASGRIQELRGLPGASGWGELSELTEWAAVMIGRQRTASRAAADLEQIEASLARTVGRLEAWRATERWEALPAEEGPAGALARELNETFVRLAEVSDQNLEAARRVRAELVSAAGDARESAEQAERSFVEATALLTTVREMQRLGQELRQALLQRADAAAPSGAAANAVERLARYRAGVGAALEAWVAASDATVDHLGAGLQRVREIAAEVEVVSQRATLVALQAVALEARLPREERQARDLSSELRVLTAEVRAAAGRAKALAAEVEGETQTVQEQLRDARDRADSLEPPAEDAESVASPAGAPVLSESARRLLERVREMIQDATQKGERLSASGERASSSAERLIRRLEEESRELEGLMIRLSPPSPDEPATTSAPIDPHPVPAELRLLDAEPETNTVTENGAEDEADAAALRTREDRP